jgi:hypothetical protein
MKPRNRSQGETSFGSLDSHRDGGDVDADVHVEAETDDQTSLVELEAYGMALWRNGLAGASRMVFKGLHTMGQAWKRPDTARYSQILNAIDGGVTYEAYTSEAVDEN